jgi:hypothetical protein
MNQQILDYIKLLTSKDKKSLIEKVVKASEEVGELSKVTLPYNNSHGTLHRFVTKHALLEEVADIMVVALSIAYDLGYSDSDIAEEMYDKTLYWNELQVKEQQIDSNKIPFEIHVTVKTYELESFKNACTDLKVKPIILELQLQNDNTLQDVMTSSTFLGSNKGAFDEVKRISEGLKATGFNVVREKIETVPWHPSAPSKKDSNAVMPKNCYFETHFNIICTDDRKAELKELSDSKQCHLSRNIFKKIDDNTYKIMVTYRSYDALYEDFKDKVEDIKKSFISNGFQVDKVILEFAIYDTKVSHDFNWINAKK